MNLYDGTNDGFVFVRRHMVENQLGRRGIHDRSVLAAMNAVPRHCFVDPEYISAAYSDRPLPIGGGQTISQPFMVAAMAEALLLEGTERVLEIGAGSGYQAAVLSSLAREVIAIETRPELASIARARLSRLGYSDVRIELGDGSAGWPSFGPYDAIVVSAAAPSVPEPLIDQLKVGGRLVIPVGGTENQQVMRLIKREDSVSCDALYHCRYVPLVGRCGWSERVAEHLQ